VWDSENSKCQCENSPLVWRFLFCNPNEYAHNTYITSTVAGIYFCCRWQSMRSSANFRTVFSESQNANPLDVQLEPDFNAKWQFKVIRFGVNEELPRGYIVQYVNCGLEWMWRFGSYSERKKRNRHFSRVDIRQNRVEPQKNCKKRFLTVSGTVSGGE